MSANTAQSSHTASSTDTDDRPQGRLLQTPSGRPAEVVDVIDTERGPRFRVLVLDLGREVTVTPRRTSWINHDGRGA